MKTWLMGVWMLMMGVVPVVLATEALYPLDSLQQQSQFQHVLRDLRCLVCQNQDLVDSHAPLAKDLRGIVYDLVRQGHTDTEIKQFLTDRYGDFVLFKPPVKGITYLLWGAPFIFLCAGVFIFIRVVRRG